MEGAIDGISEKVSGFAYACKRMPARLREWEAYKELKKLIEDFENVLPLLQELSKESIKQRHWDEVMEITHAEFDVEDSSFTLRTLIEIKIVDHADDIEEITGGADKQLKIEEQLAEIAAHWADQIFQFQPWKDRGCQVLKGVVPIVEDLEESEDFDEKSVVEEEVESLKINFNGF